MPHVPHLLLAGPWDGETISLDREASHHVATVLRRQPGDPVTYTDGAGTIGEGHLVVGGAVRRGPETLVPEPLTTVLAVAPPVARDRARFLVEKLAEIGVGELIWLRTRHGEGRPPSPDKVGMWCRAALEQSRAAWMMRVSGPVSIADLPPGTVFADTGGVPVDLTDASCVAVGPEGGWAPNEVPAGAATVSLGATVLRVETAAIVAAVRANGWPSQDHPEW